MVIVPVGSTAVITPNQAATLVLTGLLLAATPATADPQRNIQQGRNLQPTQAEVMRRVEAFCKRVAEEMKAGRQVPSHDLDLCDGMMAGPAWETPPQSPPKRPEPTPN